jgi:hypothetical protein
MLGGSRKEGAMIDRPAREALVTSVDSYLNNEIESPAFYSALSDVFNRTRDAGVHHVIDEVSDVCDGPPGKVRLTRDAWNYLQRLKLFLKSDCRIEFVSEPASSDQPAAAALLILVVITAVWFGRSPILHLVCLIAGLELWMQDRRRRQRVGPYEAVVEPFVSMEQLASVYRRSAGFRKHRYPHRTERGPADEEGIGSVIWYIVHLAAGIVVVPFGLLIACFRPGRFCVIEPDEWQIA